MENLRVCLVSYEFPPLGGGEGIYTHDLAKALRRRGAEVLLIIPAWPKQKEASFEQEQSMIRVSPLNVPGLKTTTFMVLANRKLLEFSKSYDIVHYTNDYCGFAMSRKHVGRPVFATIHHSHAEDSASVRPYLDRGLSADLNYSIGQTLISRLEKSTMQKADRVVAVSQFTAQNVTAQYPFLKDKIRVVLNAVDEKRFNPGVDPIEFREHLGLSSEPIALYVGRMAANKGLKFLVESFKEVVLEVPDAKLVIVGSGERNQVRDIKLQVAKLGLGSSVIFAGHVSDKDLPKAYASSDLVVLPSLVEGFGLVLLEGMATSKPVVTTILGPTREIVADGVEGILVPKADSRPLARAIITVLSDTSLAKRLGTAGRKKVEEKFSIERWSSQMIKLYSDQL